MVFDAGNVSFDERFGVGEILDGLIVFRRKDGGAVLSGACRLAKLEASQCTPTNKAFPDPFTLIYKTQTET